MKHPDATQMHEPTTTEEKRSRDAALDETLEGTMDASDAPSTIPNPDRDAAEHDHAEDDIRGPAIVLPGKFPTRRNAPVPGNKVGWGDRADIAGPIRRAEGELGPSIQGTVRRQERLRPHSQLPPHHC